MTAALRRRIAPAVGCPSEEAISALVEGRSGAAERHALLAHLDACESCRDLVAALLQATGATGETTREPAAGVLIGRYRLEHAIGFGGMGLVFRAHDPVLERAVAVKLINADQVTARDSERLLGEARVMARLSHPNTVGVHDAGTADGEFFIAMELIAGRTFGAWSTEAGRTPRQVLEAGMGAARGLRAAHEAGIVHRDVKPDNILVGDDGVARVSDFGLARQQDAAGSRGLRGTPEYLAPEVRAGATASAASDQYALCRTLQRCCRAAAGGDHARQGRPPGVPARAWRALERGASDAEAQRFPSLDALLDELQAALRPQRVAWVAGAAVVAALAVALTFARPRLDACAEVDARASSIDIGQTRAAVRAALADRDAAQSERWSGVVDERLRAYLGEWTTLRRAACAEAAAGADPVDSARRVACLERGWSEAAALSTSLRSDDPELARRALDAVYQLPPLRMCTSLAPLSLPAAPPPALRARVDEQQRALARGELLARAGRFAQALEVAGSVRVAGERLPHDPLVASARLLEARAQQELGKTDQARSALEEAMAAAERGGADGERAQAMIQMVGLLAKDVGDLPGALALAARAAPLVERLGNPAFVAQLGQSEAIALTFTGKLPEARQRIDAALATWTATFPGDHPRTASAHMSAGSIAKAMGDLDAAERQHRLGWEMSQRLFGDEHPDTAAMLGTLATDLRFRGREAEALEQLQRVRATLERTLGPNTLDVVMARAQICDSLTLQSRFDEARKECQSLLETAKVTFGADSPQLGYPLLLLGRAQMSAEDFEAAHGTLERALAMTPEGSQPLERADTQFFLANTLRALKREPARVLELARSARAVFAANAGRQEWIDEIDGWLGARPATGAKPK